MQVNEYKSGQICDCVKKFDRTGHCLGAPAQAPALISVDTDLSKTETERNCNWRHGGRQSCAVIGQMQEYSPLIGQRQSREGNILAAQVEMRNVNTCTLECNLVFCMLYFLLK